MWLTYETNEPTKRRVQPARAERKTIKNPLGRQTKTRVIHQSRLIMTQTAEVINFARPYVKADIDNGYDRLAHDLTNALARNY